MPTHPVQKCTSDSMMGKVVACSFMVDSFID
jgi:hypothetical protein